MAHIDAIAATSRARRYLLRLVAFLRKPATLAAVIGAVVGFAASSAFDIAKMYIEDDRIQQRDEVSKVLALGIKDAVGLESLDEKQLAGLISTWSQVGALMQSQKATGMVNKAIGRMKELRTAKADESAALALAAQIRREEEEAIKRKDQEVAKLKQAEAAAAAKKAQEAQARAVAKAISLQRIMKF